MKVKFNGLYIVIRGNRVVREWCGYYLFEDSWISNGDILINKDLVIYHIVGYKKIDGVSGVKLDKRLNVGDILYVHYDYYEYDICELRREKLKKLSLIETKFC